MILQCFLHVSVHPSHVPVLQLYSYVQNVHGLVLGQFFNTFRRTLGLGNKCHSNRELCQKKSAEIMPLFALRIMPNYATTEELCRIMPNYAKLCQIMLTVYVYFIMATRPLGYLLPGGMAVRSAGSAEEESSAAGAGSSLRMIDQRPNPWSVGAVALRGVDQD